MLEEVEMFHRSMKITTYLLTAAVIFGGMGVNVSAATSTSVLPSGGVALALAEGNKLENITTDEETIAKIQPIVEQLETIIAENPAKADELSEEEGFKNLVIAQVNHYVNVRDMPSEEGEIIGKLYNNSVGDFIQEENGWYQITSGSVTGYVKGEYCVTGEDAVEIAKQVGTRIAKVNTTTLKVRMEPSLEASVLGLIPIEDELVVLDDTEGWVKVDVEEGLGWVSKDYVDLHTEFVKAESKEEEERRLAKEEEERRKAREAAAAAARKSGSSSSKSNSNSSGSKSAPAATVSGDGSDMGRAVAEYALQFVGNPYVWGGTSLTKGADCSGFVQSVFKKYGIYLSRTSVNQANEGTKIAYSDLQPGDLVFFTNTNT